LVLPGQPSLRHAARQLGIRHAILASQVRQLEAAAGTTLLRTAPDGTITLTPDGEEFARHALAALTMAQSAHDSRHQPPSAPALG
jgi:DNA-binding transcriptional LysR family regulator